MVYSQKETCKGTETLEFINNHERKPPPKRVGGRGRNIVGKFLSEEKRNERFCLCAVNIQLKPRTKKETLCFAIAA